MEEIKYKNKVLEKKIEMVNRGINPQLSYASASIPRRDAFPPLRTPPGAAMLQREFLPPVNSKSQAYRLQPQYHQQQNQPPRDESNHQSWAQQIKNEMNDILSAIKELTANVNSSIAANKQKIDFIIGYLNLEYVASIYTTEIPSFTPAQTFLDICITNLSLTGLSAGYKITTVDYDSDHRALLFTVILPSKMQTENNIRISRRNLCAIKWKKFEKTLNAKFTQDLPDDRNLSVQELDDSIINLTCALVCANN
ncbi:hypothetical protein KQX54_014784 [Cotesia glomerata]|uniref:Endonuclease/exonuclease/phosphatase domain-containing protein n=1 Tax=Cotesia glomerata TaxID=32391 RepID=A0AAV7HJP0_COTGL|nr:hypothetical protein KQX54_014784 [Cotesia glomerata]